MKTDAKRAKPVKYVNVLLHGAYALIFDSDCIWAYTPACFAHMYNAGKRDYRENVKRNWVLKRLVDYSLVGVKQTAKRSITPDAKENPVLSLQALGIDRNTDIDPYDKRYTRIKLPYPAYSRPAPSIRMAGALHAYVGEIYSGKLASSPLNQMTSCPSMQIIVYELDGRPCGLQASDDGILIPATEQSTDPKTLNFHIFCTKSPEMASMRIANDSMTDEGHMRRAFAATVDLVGCLELTLDFPDRFYPAVPSERLPIGIDPKNDLEPGKVSGTYNILWGHVNCGSGNLIFLP